MGRFQHFIFPPLFVPITENLALSESLETAASDPGMFSYRQAAPPRRRMTWSR